jgi:hypothetical protein
MDAIERLVAIEEIKQLKAKYFYGFDHQDWDLWAREVWAPDARLEVPEIGVVVEPREAMIDWVSRQAVGQSSVHHGHMPVIEFTSDTTAKAIWAMEDRLWRTGENPMHEDVRYIHGWGHYHETYVKLDAGWRIRSTRLTRLRVEMVRTI